MQNFWWFDCQNSSCFKQNFFGILSAQKWHFKCQIRCYKCQNLFTELTPGLKGKLRATKFEGQNPDFFYRFDPLGLYLLQHTVLVNTDTSSIKLSNGLHVLLFPLGDMDHIHRRTSVREKLKLASSPITCFLRK